ncbi:MAG: hypothetical protein ACRDJY_04600 [Thermoleophilaceae bacterium]
MAVEQFAQNSGAVLPLPRPHLLRKRLGVYEVAFVGVVDHGFELVPGEGWGDVDEGADGSCYRDAPALGHVGWVE